MNMPANQTTYSCVGYQLLLSTINLIHDQEPTDWSSKVHYNKQQSPRDPKVHHHHDGGAEPLKVYLQITMSCCYAMTGVLSSTSSCVVLL